MEKEEHLPNLLVGAVLIKNQKKYFSKIKIWSMKTVDISMLSNGHLIIFYKNILNPYEIKQLNRYGRISATTLFQAT